MQLGGDCLMLAEGGHHSYLCCVGNAASDVPGHILQDATKLLFSAQQLSRQSCGILSPIAAVRGTRSSQRQGA